MSETKHFKTIVMSDVHLGSKWSKAKEANRFLKYHTCDTLILCGDIIDGKRYYVLHGDVFDHVTSSMRWLAKAGDVGYSLLMWVNRLYNRRRQRRGLPYYSVSQRIKQKVKASVSYISDFEQHLVRVARQKGCDGVICGHIHQADQRMIGEMLYLNSGDWVESLTALAEDYDGTWRILRYEEDKSER